MQSTSIRYGGPCFNMPEDSNSNLTVISSVFFNNTSTFLSNAIFFTGLEINVIDSMFSNNNPYYDEDDYLLFEENPTVFSDIIELKIGSLGGAIYIDSSIFLIENCQFLWNSAFEGGAIYLSTITKGFIESTVISNNSACYGGGIQFSIQIENAHFSIHSSYFSYNLAKESGAFMTAFITTFLLVYNNVFFANNGQQGGVFMGIHLNAAVFFRNNTFYANAAPEIANKISMYSGAGFCTAGTSTTWVLFFNNSHIKSFAYISAGAGLVFSGSYLGNQEKFYGNSAGTKGGTVVIEEFSTFFLMNSIIMGSSSSVRSGAIDITANSMAIMRNVNMSGVDSDQGGGFTVSFYSNLTVENCEFSDGDATIGGLLSGFDHCIVMFINSNIGSFGGDTAIFDVTNVQVILQNTMIVNLTTGIMALDNSIGNVIGGLMVNLTMDSQNYPAFYLEESSQLELNQTGLGNVFIFIVFFVFFKIFRHFIKKVFVFFLLFFSLKYSIFFCQIY